MFLKLMSAEETVTNEMEVRLEGKSMEVVHVAKPSRSPTPGPQMIDEMWQVREAVYPYMLVPKC